MLVFYSAEIGLKNQLTRFASIWSPQKNCFIRKLVGRSPIRFICHSSFVSQPDPRQGRGDSVTVSLDCLIPRRLAGTRKSLIGLGTDALVRCRVKTSHHGLARRR